jgi:hypothetical protein
MAKFPKGKSGNPKGRPLGSRHKATLAAQELLDGEAEALTRKAIEKALDGDGFALKLCLDRLLPPRKDRPVNLKLPKVRQPTDLPQALQAVVQAVAAGEITPAEGQALTAILEGYRKGISAADLEDRLGRLEERLG